MALAMALFVVNDIFTKLARVHWEAGQILIVRGLVAIVLIGMWIRLSGAMGGLGYLRHPRVALRAGLEAFVAATFVTALGRLPLADLTAILMLSPLLITAFSMLFFGEAVGWRRWLAVLAGFAGMLLIVRPGGTLDGPGVALALASTVGVALRDLVTRHLPAAIPSPIVVLSTTLATIVTGLAMTGTLGGWQPIAREPLVYAAIAAVFVAAGNYAIIVACRIADLTVIAPFRYTLLVWSILAGLLVFGEWPNAMALAGVGLIAGSGLYTIHRERVRRAAEAAADRAGG